MGVFLKERKEQNKSIKVNMNNNFFMKKKNIFQNRKKFFKKVSFKFFEISFISSLIKDSWILLSASALNLLCYHTSRSI